MQCIFYFCYDKLQMMMEDREEFMACSEEVSVNNELSSPLLQQIDNVVIQVD